MKKGKDRLRKDSVSARQRYVDEIAQHQRDVWDRLIEQRFNRLRSDRKLGGKHLERSLANARYALENMVGLTKKEATDLIAIMDAGGVSHHRLTIKMLNNVYQNGVTLGKGWYDIERKTARCK